MAPSHKVNSKLSPSVFSSSFHFLASFMKGINFSNPQQNLEWEVPTSTVETRHATKFCSSKGTHSLIEICHQLRNQEKLQTFGKEITSRQKLRAQCHRSISVRLVFIKEGSTEHMKLWLMKKAGSFTNCISATLPNLSTACSLNTTTISTLKIPKFL